MQKTSRQRPIYQRCIDVVWCDVAYMADALRVYGDLERQWIVISSLGFSVNSVLMNVLERAVKSDKKADWKFKMMCFGFCAIPMKVLEGASNDMVCKATLLFRVPAL